MSRKLHSEAFTHVRDEILALENDRDRARLAAFFGTMTAAGAPLGDLRRILRSIAALSDDDLERLVGWFSTHVNRWGQMPRAAALRIKSGATRIEPPTGREER